MKKILIILISVITSLNLKGQDIGLLSTYEFNLNRIGGVINYLPTHQWGGFIGYSQGYKYGITNRKGVIGINIPINSYYHLMAGINHNFYTLHTIPSKYSEINPSKIYKTSMTIGLNLRLSKHINIILLGDVLNWEFDLGIGYIISHKKRKQQQLP